ncbi:MAG: aldehyde dehydrogenase family protein [Methanobacteriota archaeon]
MPIVPSKSYGIFVDGKWVASESKKTITTINPATGEALATFPDGTAGDAEKAIQAAARAFPAWAKTPPPRRGEILLKAADLFRRAKDELGLLVTREMGKSLKEGMGDAQEAIDFFQYISGEGRRLFGETTTSELPNKFAMSVRRPKGVVACITPWNFPIAIPSWKIGAALISGCTVVFKPASTTPLCGARFVEVLAEAGVPPGAVNMVTGSGSVVGRTIVESRKVKHISFTGGVVAGRDVYSRAAQDFKSVELEMGGKNPQIVLADANLPLALEGVLWGAFGTAGQRCTATSRLILEEPVYDEFLGMLVDAAKRLTLGDPSDPKIDVGPVHSKQQEDTILDYVNVGKKENAKLLLGGRKLTGGKYDKGFFIEPTIFAAQHGMRITKEEIFGPVLSVIKVRDFDEALRVANDIDYGLSSSLYTRDVNKTFRAIESLETGITYVNAPTIGAEVHLPFGGVKNTGNGGREAGTAAIHQFTEWKSVYVDYSDRLQRAQIDVERAE